MIFSSSWFSWNILEMQAVGGDYWKIGLPFVYYTYSGCPTFPSEMLENIECPTISFNIYLFILDITIWYFLSCLIISTYNKLRKTKR